MKKIGHGIDIYYENDQKNILLLSDGRSFCYYAGSMLIEMSGEDAHWLINDRIKNMIHIFPDYQAELGRDSIVNAIKWLYSTVTLEKSPILTEIFQSSFTEIIREILRMEKEIVKFNCIGDFLVKCYNKFKEFMEMFWLGVDSLANVNSDIEDSFSEEMVEILTRKAEKVYPIFSKKCSNRRKKKTEKLEEREIATFNLKMPSQILIFEYCRMRKTGYVLKKCANCKQYFIAQNRKAIFCTRPSPQDLTRSCKMIGPQIRRNKKRESDITERMFHREYTRWAMQAKKARDNNMDETYYYDHMKSLTENHKKGIK